MLEDLPTTGSAWQLRSDYKAPGQARARKTERGFGKQKGENSGHKMYETCIKLIIFW